MAINAGVNISKMVGFAVLAPEAGVNVTKMVGFALLAPEPGLNVIKLVGYGVLGSPNVAPPLWGTWSFPDGIIGVAYDQDWDMPTSAETVGYSVLVGGLPDGLSLSAITGNQAHVHGIPYIVNTFNFTLRALNDFGTVDKAFSITILSPGGAGIPSNSGFLA